jgi:SAM-dependent methyltransferase
MDIPRIFNITESAHRIHNPITPEKLATLGAALRLESGERVLDLGSGSGEMLCTWARDHGITGTGIDMSQLFTEQAKRRAEELGVADQVKFVHGNAAGYVSDEKVDVAACVGATWIAGGVSPELSGFWRAACAAEESSSLANPTGGSYRRRKMSPRGVLPTQFPTFSCFQNFSRLSAALTTMSLKWFWPTKTVGTDTKRPNGSPCADGLKTIPMTSWRKRFAPN